MLSRLCGGLLGMLGWTLHPDYPAEEKYVMIVAPHTSNWDFIVGILAAWALGLRAHWLGKHTLFWGPLGWFFRRIGGLPVDRGRSDNLIRQMAESFATADRPILAMAPEGTRKHTDHWKAGFYHIARTAGVPVVMAYLDYSRKQIGFGGCFYPGDDIEHVFDHIRAYYRERRGKRPEFESTIAPPARRR